VAPSDERARLRSLASVARALGRSEALNDLLEVAAEEARTALSAATVSVSRLVPGTLMVRTIINVGDLGPQETRWPEDETYFIDEFDGLRIVLDSLETWSYSLQDASIPESERRLLLDLGKGSSLGAPLVVDGRLWGEFYATRHVGEPGFVDVDAAYLEALLAILSGGVSRALAEESLEELAYHDPLTGLQNRRALDQHAHEVFAQTEQERTVTAVTLDINRLKEVNDTLGHEAGDRLIQAVASDLRDTFGMLEDALVARVGGDEFTVLVTGSELGEVLRLSDRLCRRIWDFGPGCSISAGAASVVVSRDLRVTPEHLFAAADRAQYVAKHGRLARTVLSEEVGGDSESSGRSPQRPEAGRGWSGDRRTPGG
jgi:diguanylate cyclase (GGDEF)-like protein